MKALFSPRWSTPALLVLAAATTFGAAAEVRRMSMAELKPMVAEKRAIVLDVRSPEAWKQSHAEGAINIPLDQLASRMKELPKDKLIAAYCT